SSAVIGVARATIRSGREVTRLVSFQSDRSGETRDSFSLRASSSVMVGMATSSEGRTATAGKTLPRITKVNEGFSGSLVPRGAVWRKLIHSRVSQLPSIGVDWPGGTSTVALASSSMPFFLSSLAMVQEQEDSSSQTRSGPGPTFLTSHVWADLACLGIVP